MCQTLLFIPHEVLGIPVFGFGWFLLAWGVISIGWVTWAVRKDGWSPEVKELLGFLLVTAVAIIFILPRIEVRAANGDPLGLPVRGYGTLLLTGVLAAWWLSARRAAQRGFNTEVLASLAWRLIVAGVIGARLFYVIEYWPDFRRPSWHDTLVEVLTFTKGGLVVYGSLIGGFVAFVWYLRQKRLSMFAWGDIIAPGLILGMAIGRIGCLLNGCCYGGECDQGKVCIRFPRFSSKEQQVMSPPYMHQLVAGRLHGFTLGKNKANQPTVKSVEPDGPAEQNGLVAGVRIAAVNGVPTDSLQTAEEVLAHSGPDISIELADGQRLKWSVGTLPNQSRPVHPSQIYGAISGFLICLLLIAVEPFINRSGATMAALLTLYPPVRFFEEMIRDDEPPQWGTALTISQLISLCVIAGAMVTWYFVLRRGKRGEG